MNLFKVFRAGLSSWGETIITNWKKILLWVVLTPVLIALWAVLVSLGAEGLASFVKWLTTFKGLNDFVEAHALGIVFGMFGTIFVWLILFSLYRSGKDKLDQNDKVSSI